MYYFNLLDCDGEILQSFVAPCKISDEQIKKVSKKAWLKAIREASGFKQELIEMFGFEFNAKPIEIENVFRK